MQLPASAERVELHSHAVVGSSVDSEVDVLLVGDGHDQGDSINADASFHNVAYHHRWFLR